MEMRAPLIDMHCRRITYLRLSVTDRCDLRCTYCMPEAMQFLPRKEVLTLEELYQLACGFMARGVRNIRLTGGEPLVRRDMIQLVRMLGRHIGTELDELTLTTNGTQLARFAGDLAQAGVRRVNVSLDTLNPRIFEQLSRRNQLDAVLGGIAAAAKAGLKVKINTVALRGVNEDEIPDLIAWAHGAGHDLSLIETMPLGEVDADRAAHYLPLNMMRKRLEEKWTLTPTDYQTSGPARYVAVAETGGRLGFITPMSDNFCAGCNRMRVTATGQLFPCLGGGERVDLRAALRAGANSFETSADAVAGSDAVTGSEAVESRFEAAMDQAMRIKPQRHHFLIAPEDRANEPSQNEVSDRKAPAITRHMSMTGG